MLAKQPTLNYDEYLAYEQTSPIKHEFLYGQAFAMAVASEIHNLIAGSLFSQLRLHLRTNNCRVFMSDMKLSIAAADNATYYPDIMVVCDPTDQDPYVKQQPCLLVEVLSPSTAAIDEKNY